MSRNIFRKNIENHEFLNYNIRIGGRKICRTSGTNHRRRNISMKKSILIILAIAMLLSLAACGKKEAEEPFIDPNSSFAADFTDKLYAIQQNYHPGTAGCSLTAAALAAEIMDIFTEYHPSEKLIRDVVKEFADSLKGDAAAEYPAQIDAVISASEQLNAENGKDLLDSCGYAGSGYPWNAEEMAKYFSAVQIG